MGCSSSSMQPLRHRGRDGGARQIGQHDAELVAAQPRHHVFVAQHARQARPDLLQQLVAEVVAERVVDLLEVVEVDQHHAEGPADGARALDRVGELELEEQAVRQTRERVVERLVFVLGLFLCELVGRLLQRVRALEHLPREHQRRGEHEDREGIEPGERGGDEHREHRETEVREDELAEHTPVHLADRGPQPLPRLEPVVEGDQEGVRRVAGDRGDEGGDRSPPTG